MKLKYYDVDRNFAASLERPHVYKPGTNSRTILLLHGTGADERDLLGVGKLLDPNANLLSPRGLVVHQGMARFFLRFEDGKFDEAGMRANADDLALFVENAAEHYKFDPTNVWAAGFSNGANASGALLLTHPNLLRGIFAFGTTKSFEQDLKPRPNLAGKHVFIGNGALDGYSPAERTDAMVKEFEACGAQVKLMLHPGGHTIVSEHLRSFADDLLRISDQPN